MGLSSLMLGVRGGGGERGASTSFQKLVSLTKLLTSHVHGGRHREALSLFSKLSSTPDLHLDPFVFTLALNSCAALRLPSSIAALHCRAHKSGFLSNHFVASALVDSYGKTFADVRHARQLFDECPNRNVVVWNAMISLYSHARDIENTLRVFDLMDVAPNESSFNAIIGVLAVSEKFSEAVGFYRRMATARDLKPNLITLLALLPACIGLSVLGQMKEIQAFAVRAGLQHHSFLASSLIEAYGRCGSLSYARKVFDGVDDRDLVVWSSMLSAYAFHGQAAAAVSILKEMEATPDGITFLGILKACGHAGLADDALTYFELMTKKYGIEAQSDHYSCLVDVLGRAGRLREAYGMVKKMPLMPTAKTWGAILSACRSYGEVELAELASQELMKVEPENPGSFVLLASVYSNAGRFEEADRVRKEMIRRGLASAP